MRRTSLLWGLGTGLSYLLLACLLTWPLISQLSEVLPGASQDSLLHYWNGFAVQHALSGGRSPYLTNLIFYPQGANLISHNLAWFQILPWLVLSTLINGIAAYNLVLIFNLAFSGLAAYLLARYVTGDYRAAFLAGLIYLAWPFRLSQLDHPNLLATAMIPLFLLFLLKTLHDGRWRNAGLAAVFLALVGYGRWQLLIPAGLAALVFILWHWRQWWPVTQHKTLWRLLFSGVCAALLLLPPAILLLREQLSNPAAADLLREDEEALMQTDLLAYVIPGSDHLLLRGWTGPFYDSLYEIRFPTRRYTAYLGLIAVLLSLLALLRRFREAAPWLVLTLLLIGLALGHDLRFNRQAYPMIPTLYRLLEPLGLFRLMRVPDRYNMFIALPVAMMSGLGAAVLLARVAQRWLQNAVTIALAVLILLEYLAVPVTVRANPTLPGFYQDLAREEGEFAILNLPIDSLIAKSYMFDQIVHGRPIMQGNLSRTPRSAFDTINGTPFLASLKHEVEMDPRLQDVSRQLAGLNDLGIRYLILHKDKVGADRILHWQRYLLTEPLYEDEQYALYQTTFVVDRDTPLLTHMADGLGPVRTILARDCLAPGEQLALDIGWGSTKALEQGLMVEIALQSAAGPVALAETFALSPGWPTSQWPENTLAWGYYSLPLPPDFPAGQYELVAQLIEENGGEPIGEPFAIEEIRVQETPCPLSAELAGAQEVHARYGDALSLLAYEMTQDDKLKIRLYWQALQHMPQDYTLFVHIFDPATGLPAAQHDGMPHQGAYRTSYWGFDEIITEDVEVWLADLPPGEYGLAIGVYDAATGQRLIAVDGQGQELPDGRLILPHQIDISE